MFPYQLQYGGLVSKKVWSWYRYGARNTFNRWLLYWNSYTNLENIPETNNTQRDITNKYCYKGRGRVSKEFRELREFSDYTSITKLPKLIKFLNKTPRHFKLEGCKAFISARAFQVRRAPSATLGKNGSDG